MTDREHEEFTKQKIDAANDFMLAMCEEPELPSSEGEQKVPAVQPVTCRCGVLIFVRANGSIVPHWNDPDIHGDQQKCRMNDKQWCDCHLHDKQVCDVCQGTIGVDIDVPSTAPAPQVGEMPELNDEMVGRAIRAFNADAGKKGYLYVVGRYVVETMLKEALSVSPQTLVEMPEALVSDDYLEIAIRALIVPEALTELQQYRQRGPQLYNAGFNAGIDEALHALESSADQSLEDIVAAIRRLQKEGK